MGMNWMPFNAGGGKEFVVGIKVDDSQATALGRFIENLKSITPAAEQAGRAMGGLGQAAGTVMGMLGGMGGVAAGIGGGLALINKANADEAARNGAAAPFGMGGAGAIDLRWGRDASSLLNFVGHANMMTTQEILGVGEMMSGELGRGQGLQAFTRYGGFNRVGLGGPGVAGAISGLMRRGYGVNAAGNIAFTGLGMMSQENLAGMPRLLGQAQTFGFSDSEAMAFLAMVDQAGGSEGTAEQLLSSLAGKGPQGDEFLRRAGVGRGASLSSRVAALGRIRSDDEARAIGGRSTAFLGELAAGAGGMGSLAARFREAAGSDADLLEGYRPSSLVAAGVRARRDKIGDEYWNTKDAERGRMFSFTGLFSGDAAQDRAAATSALKDAAREAQRETARLQMGGG